MIRILFTCFILVSSYHDFHYSKTVADYNSDTGTIQTVSHLFTDDLEDDVKRTYGIDLRLGEVDEFAKADSIIKEYIFSNFTIRTSDKQLQLDWIGYEFDYDIVYTYVESEPHDLDSTYSVKLDYFHELFEDQENFIKLSLPNRIVTDITSKINPVADFND